MALLRADLHPHGFSNPMFRALFTDETDVVIGFHGYSRAVHQLLHGRPNPQRFHRYHLARLALEFARTTPVGADKLVTHCESQLARRHAYIAEHLEDLPEVRDWTWPARSGTTTEPEHGLPHA